jgi:Secretion system C-terminal sorting domain
MYRKFLPLLPFFALLTVFTPRLSGQTTTCQYTLIMADTYGDGWNGGILTVKTGNQTTQFTLSIGFADTLTFDVFNGQPLTFTWAAGAFLGEVSYTILDNIGSVVAQATSPLMPPSGTLYSGVGACVTCSAPLNFKVDNVWDTYVKLAWKANPASPNPAVRWKIIYGLQGFNLAAGAGDTVTTSIPKITITGLQKKTWYDAYIQQDCDTIGGFSLVSGPISFETYWTKDVGIIGVVSPTSGCDLGLDTVRILLKNFGAAPQSLINMRYTVNGEEVNISKPDDGVYTNVLGKDSIEVFEFETTYDFSEPGEYVIVAYSKFVGDQDVHNDTFTYYFTNRLLSPYNQNFENWNGGWTVSSAGTGAASFEFGAPDKISIPAAASGQNAWVTNLVDDYNSNELSYLESPCFDFSQLTVNPAISFSIARDMESEYDGAWLEMSVNEGTTWTKIGNINEGLNWYNEEIVMGTGIGTSWSGNSDGWQTARHTLNGVAGQSNVRLRFVFASETTVQAGGLGIDDVRIFPAFNKDLAGTGIVISSETEQCGLENEPVTFTFVNVGAQTQSSFQVAYSVNGGTPVVETVTSSIAPDQIRSYTFSTKFDSRDKVSIIKCWTKLAGESAPANDTATLTIDHLPLPTPFSEDFESLEIPQGWITNGTVTNAHGNTSFVLSENLYSFNPEFEHILPRYGIIGDNDSLSFAYRIVNFSGGNPTVLALGTKFELQVSTDCGETFQTINTINSGNHTPTAMLRTRKFSLADYSGQSIIIRFLGTWTSGDFYFDLDNINLLSCPADMVLSATITNATPGQSNGAATVNVGLGNPPYTYNWSNGSTGATVGNLAIGTYTVTVQDAYGCSDFFEFSVGTSAVQEMESLASVSLNPNPTTGQAIFVAEFNRSVGDVRLQVLNMLGQTVWEAQASNTRLLSERIDLAQAPGGLYLVQLVVDGAVLTKKLVKQ